MSIIPEPSGWEKVIRAVSSVKTRSGLAALVLVLLFFMFWITILITTGILQWILSLLVLLMFGIFAYLVVFVKDITVREDKVKIKGNAGKDV